MGEVNFMMAFAEALAKDQRTMQEQELADTKTEKLAIDLEQNVFNYWNIDDGGGQLGRDAAEVAKYTGKKDASKQQAAQTQYNKDAATAQSIESGLDRITQQGQNQVAADGSNLATMAQMLEVLSGIQTTTSQLLGRLGS